MWHFKFISAFLFILYGTTSFSQDPNYFVLGASELKNADIYSVIHTKEHKLYIATDEGLYEYTHGKMQHIRPAKEQRGNSLFNLVENKKNEVFCFNLNGQIFKIEENRLEFFFQIPEKYFNELIEINFDDRDSLIVCTGGCFFIEEGEIKEIFYNVNYKNTNINKLNDGTILIGASKMDTIYKIKDGLIEKKHSNLSGLKNGSRFKILEIEGELYTSLYLNELIDNELPNSKLVDRYRHHQISEKELWARSTVSGVKIITPKGDKLENFKSYFSNTFISTISVNDEQTIFLGTFGKGLFVVPSTKTKVYKNIIRGNELQHIAVDDKFVYTTDINEGIFVLNKSNLQMEVLSNFNPNKIFTLSKNKSNVYPKYPNLFFTQLRNYSDVKNILEIDSTTYLTATSNGLICIGNKSKVPDLLWQRYHKAKFTNIYHSKKFNKRCSDMAFDPSENTLYVSMMTYLKIVKKDGTITELNYGGTPIIANDLLFEDGLLWCATQNHGILVFKDNHISFVINTSNGLGNNYVSKFEKQNNRLFISHKSGFQIFDLQHQKWHNIGSAEGIESGTIKDFCLDSDKIWFISNNQVNSFNHKDLDLSVSRFKIKIDSIKVNEKKVSLIEKGQFQYNENNIEFFTTFSGILSESEVEITYILKELNTNQIIQQDQISIEESIIDFRFLPAGEYNFTIKAIYRDSESDPQSYTFTIKRAYWQTYWFYLICTLLILIITSLLFWYRNKQIHRNNLEKLEKQTLKTEAIQAELKALRSQMNPHFIFNSLNSIQDLILKEDTEASYDYLVLFSELVRNALSYSNQNLISLHKEISFLKAYLKLEKLRFGKEFEYTIYDESIKTLFVPSLIIQPFVENAVEHGVFHIKGKKTIDIKFAIDKQELICTITDNGKGREFSQKIRSKSRNKHKSFALEAVAKRLQILKNKYGGNIGFDIFDIFSAETLKGTKVVVRLPLLYKNPDAKL